MSTFPLQPLVDDLTARIQALGAERDDLIILADFMADTAGATAREVADAVAKPWKFADVLAEAKAALTGRDL